MNVDLLALIVVSSRLANLGLTQKEGVQFAFVGVSIRRVRGLIINALEPQQAQSES